MPPSGLQIHKLGLEGCTDPSSSVVRGLLCLKLSLPRDVDSRIPRLALFGSKPPRLLSAPCIYPLPIPHLALSRHPNKAKQLRTASTLLGLPGPSAYPPSSPVRNEPKPSVEVNQSTGQVFLTFDPGRNKNRKDQGNTVRREWLLVVEFEVEIIGSESGVSKVSIPVPKCLDNVLRLKISQPVTSTSSMGAIDLVTHPKMLPLPETFFELSEDIRPPSRGQNRAGRLGAEEGWEDGEIMGPDDHMDELDGYETENNDDDDGTWVLGRFQSTDFLQLEWSFASAIPKLIVNPSWHPQTPSISLSYETLIEAFSILPLFVDLPDGWGWQSLDISADGLRIWRSTDSSFFSSQTSSNDMDDSFQDDSFATVRNKSKSFKRPSILSNGDTRASLLAQTMPNLGDDTLDDFSFEIPQEHSSKPLHPMTPTTSSLKSSSMSKPSSMSYSKGNVPVHATCFELEFEPVGSGSTADRRVQLQGTLVPLSSLTFVSCSLPCQLPIVRLDIPSAPTTCQITYPTPDHPSNTITYDMSSSAPPFIWLDSSGRSIAPQPLSSVQGEIMVRVERDAWHSQTIHLLVPIPKKTDSDIGFSIPCPGPSRTCQIVRASIGGKTIPRCVVKCDDRFEIRLRTEGNMGSGGSVTLSNVEITIQVEHMGDIVAVPHFPSAVGSMTVHLEGKHWGDLSKLTHQTNLKYLSSTHYNISLPCPTPPFFTLTTPKTKKSKTIFSLGTFINIFFLYLLLSMGQQVQRLRNEVTFLSDEARDLRLYTIELQSRPITPPPSSLSPENVDERDMKGIKFDEVGSSNKYEQTSVARVVLQSAWGEWANHPTQGRGRERGEKYHLVLS
ncbi:hypothetical protein TREMEDRAFT_74241 [Tremella mesenterica DSM 1558]|uniref:uncharacterized protein n=1 Tax=Tremella mesenterica (strain ATCC 24925 / CBS 8224 / DSM 1558 / NBRC 9311 / NRRL Y-6157 / RJB 2259-6 / UBC 559-6) TaxID=578456 RepID=UPI0003F49161|nr:uncharacterized protein TREMEDRAFT_74241 [Tremella mesenterica DSM 1558]EIW68326.1 hypothetical protein TREMEDRAFT_74241 [Tremella mesenterica DSM 1558]